MKIDENSSLERKPSNSSEVAEDSLQPLIVRRKSGLVPRKFPSLQVSHYPVLLLAKNGILENQSSVTWKTSQQSDSSDSEPPNRKLSGNLRQSPIPPIKKKSLDYRTSEERPRFVRNYTTSTLSPTTEKPPTIIGHSSSGRLHPSPKVSFSSIVQHTMKCKAMGGMGSGRCLSSASPISAVERQQLWGTSMHHSFDDRPTASSDDLFASCNDIDQQYRQQRKRRAGISGGSTTVTRDMPFACAGGNGYSSAGVSNGKGYPSLGGRSPQSSFDSNQDVAQISMNWMRMNGLGPSLRPFLNGNHTPKKTQIQNSQSTTQISRIGSLRRMHAAEQSIDGKFSLCGTQPDVSVGFVGEILFELSPSFFTNNKSHQSTTTPSTANTTPTVQMRATHSTSSIVGPRETQLVTAPTSPNADHAPKSILRAPRLTAAPKQCSFDVPPSPSPTPKTSCVSASGSYHMFERPNRLRAGKLSYSGLSSHPIHSPYHNGGSPNRGDPTKWRLADVKQRSNSESMFRMYDPEFLTNGGRRMSMAYIPSREQALLRKILGPQGLSWISYDRETASRKSVSIAYSNDIEAGGKGGGNGGDDSTIPLMDDKDENSGGRLIKREYLHEKRRMVCDRALGFAIIGIMLMIIENEFNSRLNSKDDAHHKWGRLITQSLGALIVATTAALLSFVGYFHVVEIQLFMNANAAEDWMVALTLRRILQIIVEIFICMLCPLPQELFRMFTTDTATLKNFNVFLSIMMFFRLYWVCRVMLLHSRLFTDASSRSIAGLNRVNFNARFILKTLMTLCPGTMLMIFTASLWVVAGWILRLCERTGREGTGHEPVGYIDSIWLVAITFLSVGYGDIVPKTYCGRSMAVVTGILGTCASSMVVAVIARKLELTRAEKHVHNFMQDTQLTKQLKHSAANVLRETWFIYKYRKLVDKCDFGKVRQHQRKFLVAIYEMRRVKRDQRKLAENLVSLGDVAKTSSNTYELVHDVHSTQEGLSLRITAIEHQLSDISRELSNLTELLRGSEQRKKSVLINDSSNSSPRLRRKVGELHV